MKKINLFLSLIAVVMLVGLTNCKKDTENTSVTKYVGTVNGSFIAKDASIKVNKDLAPNQLVTRNWIMYAKNSPFYGNQPFALVKGLEFITGSAAQQWWSVPANNPVSFAASQAVYSNLTPAEPVRLVMVGYGSDATTPAYLGILDFDPTAAQFPLAVTSKSLGDKLIVNADGLTSKPGGSSISVLVSFQAATVNLQATETKSQLSSGPNEGQQTGVTGALDFSDIVYNAPQQYSSMSVGAGDYTVWSASATKIQGTITLTITFAPSPSAPGVSGGSTTLTVPAAGPGQYKKIVLTTTKLGWYDSATIGVNDQDISVDVTNVSVDGQDNQNGGDQGTLPPVSLSIPLNFSSPYQIYTGVADAPETAQLGIFLIMDYPSAQAFIKNVGSSQEGGEIIDMGQKDLISLMQANHNYLPTGPPTTGYSSNTYFIVGHSYIIRYRKSINYLTSNAPYHYGIFYVTNMDVDPNGYRTTGVTINYEGPFDN